jgi:hypothetical protein
VSKCSGCSRDFVPSRRHKRECIKCFRKSERSPQNAALQAALANLDEFFFLGRTTDQRDNQRSLAKAILKEMVARGVFTIPNYDLPPLWGKHREQVRRTLPGVLESGLLQQVRIRDSIDAVRFVKGEINRQKHFERDCRFCGVKIKLWQEVGRWEATDAKTGRKHMCIEREVTRKIVVPQ